MRRRLTDFLRARTRGFLLRSIAFAVVALAPASADAQWRRLDSPNFVVIGEVPARDLRDVAVQFEGFRETLTRVFGARITTSTVPTVVVVFPTDRAAALLSTDGPER